MTVSIGITAIMTALSDLSITGLTFCDTSEIPEGTDPFRVPMLFPIPDRFISDFVYTRDSYGGGSTALAHVNYNINLRLCYAPMASGRGLFDVYPSMVAMVVLILNKLIVSDTLSTAVDVQVAGVPVFGKVFDIHNNIPYHGAEITVSVMEFVN